MSAYAANVSGALGQFNAIQETWIVPVQPNNRENVEQLTLWMGVQDPGEGTLIQPELWYHGNSNTWNLQAQVCTPQGKCPAGSPVPTASGNDIIGLAVIQNYSGTEGYEWYILAEDSTTGQASYYQYWTFAPETQAFLGQLEVQGLAACDGLPGANITGSNAQLFNIETLAQQSTSGWQYEVNVIDSVSYFGNEGQPSGPSCDYAGTMLDGAYPYLTWLAQE